MNDASPDDAACNNLTNQPRRLPGVHNTWHENILSTSAVTFRVSLINNTAVRTKRKNPPRNKNVDYGQIQLLGFTAVA
jgi:hypothetical protein